MGVVRETYEVGKDIGREVEKMTREPIEKAMDAHREAVDRPAMERAEREQAEKTREKIEREKNK